MRETTGLPVPPHPLLGQYITATAPDGPDPKSFNVTNASYTRSQFFEARGTVKHPCRQRRKLIAVQAAF